MISRFSHHTSDQAVGLVKDGSVDHLLPRRHLNQRLQKQQRKKNKKKRCQRLRGNTLATLLRLDTFTVPDVPVSG